MTTNINEAKLHKRQKWAWYMYDFGNSAYAAVILLAVFSKYFVEVVAKDASLPGTTLWNYAVVIAAVIVALISPVLGTIADFSRSKKKLLFIFTAIAVMFTGLLFFVQGGDVFLAMTFFILAEIGYRASQVFYDSLLVDISTPETIGKISGNGWAMGMLGGIVCLVIILIPIQVIGGALMVRLAFIITALFFLISSIPVFLLVKQVNEPETLPAGMSTIRMAFKKLAETFKNVKRYKEFIKYALAFLIYNDGIMMLMDNAALIAAILFGFKTSELIVLIIILQVAGAAGSFLFGWISNKYSSKQAIVYALIMLMAVIGCLYITDSKTLFYFIGALAGFSLSGVQAVSRTMVSQLSPKTKTTEFFGFLSVAGRTSTAIGPFVFGTTFALMLTWYTNRNFAVDIANKNAMYWAIGTVVAFLVIGLIFLLRVKKVTHKTPINFD
ncbi:MAG: MFS transporter UMF1 family [Anaerolineaceae bacterium]|nr:MAG: MFS transporter UMF1 family [Anaerolineaceae bacterium]